MSSTGAPLGNSFAKGYPPDEERRGVALVFNNILDPRGLPAQLALFENAARHLEPGGCFVIEAYVLDDDARSGAWNVSPRYVGEAHVEFQLARFDLDSNRLERTLVHLRPEGMDFVSVKDSYAAPGELDVMAHVNGMRRIARYGGWSREPFTSQSRRHITVYELEQSRQRSPPPRDRDSVGHAPCASNRPR